MGIRKRAMNAPITLRLADYSNIPVFKECLERHNCTLTFSLLPGKDYEVLARELISAHRDGRDRLSELFEMILNDANATLSGFENDEGWTVYATLYDFSPPFALEVGMAVCAHQVPREVDALSSGFGEPSQSSEPLISPNPGPG
jgi:hypothetical protein